MRTESRNAPIATSIDSLALAVVNYVAGRLGLLLAIPPGFASAIFPPSGIALAALLAFGVRLWPGVLLGSLAFNLHVAVGDQGLTFVQAAPVSLSIAVGSTLQALLGVWLIRRFVGYPNALDDERSIAGFLLLGGPVACLLAASWGITTLSLSGVENAGTQWLVWWAGDTLGVLYFTPLLLIPVGEPREAWRSRRITVGVPAVAAFAALVVLYVVSSSRDADTVAAEFERRTNELANSIERTVATHLDAVHALAGFHMASNEVSPPEFDQFVRHWFDRHPGLLALEWVPRIGEAEREAFLARAEFPVPMTRFQLKRWTGNGWEPANDAFATEYFPVTHVQPVEGNEPAIGNDMGSHPERRRTMDLARDLGTPVATPHLDLAQGGRAFLVFAPVFDPTRPHETVAERRAGLRGYALGLFRVGDLVAAAAERGSLTDAIVRIEDRTGEGREIVFGPEPTSEEASRLSREHDFGVAERDWRIAFVAREGFFTGIEWHGAATLTAGLLFTSLLTGFLLLVTGRQQRIAGIVEERTRELSEATRERELILDSVGEGVYGLDMDGNTTFANRTAARLIGWTVAELLGRSQHDVLHHTRGDGTPYPRDECPIYAAFTDGVERHVTGEVFWRRDGSSFPVEYTSTPLRDDDGRIVGAVVVFRDVTEQHERAVQLERQRVETRAILDHIPAFVWLKDDRNTVLRVNRAVAESLDRPLAEIEGCPSRELYPDHADQYYADDLVVLDSGAPRLGIIEPVATKEGERWVRTDKIPLPDETGELRRILVVATDVTDLRLIRAELAHRTEERDRYFELALDMLCIAGLDGRLERVNPSFERVLGWTEEELLSGTLPNLAHLDDREATCEVLAGLAEGRPVTDFRAQFRCRDGSFRWLSWNFPLPDDRNRLFAVARDITESIRQTEALAEKSEELERSNEDLVQFAYVASHDLRAPLRGISHLTEWMVEDHGEVIPDEAREHLDRIREQCVRMDTLLNGLLEYSRVGRKRFRVENVDVADLVRDVVAMLQPPEPFTVEWPDDMPTLRIERSPLQRVFLNLVSNAIKHHPREDGTVRITCREPKEMPDRVEFSVNDDGDGIPEELHAKAFELFRMLKPREANDSTGMGLALVARLVEVHGGEVRLDSAEGEGATFTFSWPRVVEHDQPPEVE